MGAPSTTDRKLTSRRTVLFILLLYIHTRTIIVVSHWAQIAAPRSRPRSNLAMSASYRVFCVFLCAILGARSVQAYELPLFNGTTTEEVGWRCPGPSAPEGGILSPLRSPPRPRLDGPTLTATHPTVHDLFAACGLHHKA